MANQVQIPFEGVILQEHSAPISCPTPNFAKGSHKKSGTMRNDQGVRALCDQIRQTAFDLHGYLRNRHLEKGYEKFVL